MGFQHDSCVCDAEGRFEVEVPSESSYPIRVTLGGAYAKVRPSHSEVIGGIIEIELSQLFFERLAFHDPRGAPVPVTGRLEVAAMPRAQPVYASLYNLGTFETDWLPAWVDVASVGENEYAYIVAGEAAQAARNIPSRRLDLQGYLPVEIPMAFLPLEKWPESVNVVLTPDPGEALAVPHRVLFPESAPPQGWQGEAPARWLEIIAGATTEGSKATTYWVNRAHPVFRVPTGTRFTFKLMSEMEPRPYHLRDEGHEVQVVVDWPPQAFVDLEFVPRHPDVPEASPSIVIWSNVRSGEGGQLVQPGHVRFAYLPEGSYMMEISWWRAGERAPFSAWRLRAPFDIAAGPNTIQVADHDFLASSNR